MNLRIHRFLAETHVEGPGKRACIWVQGCPHHCPGCAVPAAWPEDGGELTNTKETIHRISNGADVEGVTFVGGEPFAQAAALAELGKTLRNTGLSVVCFTGYVLEYLLAIDRTEWNDLLAVTDLLIDGPYRRDLADFSRPWVGSSNQRYHYLTDRYLHLETTLQEIPNRMEVQIRTNGSILINGMGDITTVHELFDNVELLL